VIVSLAEYQSLKETAYLLRSPANARRLLEAIEELESGGGQARSLDDLADGLEGPEDEMETA
jgi:antitoxin YefM